MRFLTKGVIGLYVTTIVGLFLYSYTQVDLSLTLSQFSLWQVIEKTFQYVGYFQRPISTYLYVTILFLLLFSYAGILISVIKRRISRKNVWFLIIFSTILLTFSYNAFSYDLFNYIFDAKIVTHYLQNPYLYKALDFPKDPMLSFMHWTQRTYPYGPVWLLVTIPISFIGSQFFLPTFFLFKMIASLSYLGICWSIEKILQKTEKENSLVGLSFFAFSPLVIIEGLVSAHNDMLMVLFISLALITFMNRKSIWSFLLLFLSIGVKFATTVLLPLWIIGFFVKKEGSMQRLALICFVLSFIPLVVASLRTNFQPWYLLFLFPFPSLMLKQKEILISFTIFSFLSLFQYIPFLYSGNWNNPIPMVLSIMLWTSVGISILVGAILLAFRIAKRT